MTRFSICVLVGLALAASACSDQPEPPVQAVPTFDATPRQGASLSEAAVFGPSRRAEQVRAGAIPPAAPAAPIVVHAQPTPIPLKPTVEALSLEQVTLPNFIKEIFSNALHLTVQIDQRVQTRTDIVTLRTGNPLPAQDLLQMAEKILAGYGIGVSWDGSVLNVAPEDALMAQMPDMIRSRALPEMPIALRPIFQVVALHQVSAPDIASWLTDAYGAKIKVFPAAKLGAIMIFGLPANVRIAVDAVSVLDQARLAGRQSLRIGLVYWTAKALAAKLVDVLHAEGYDASIADQSQPNQVSAIMLIPVETTNSLIAFAADAKVLAHIRKWVGDLDQAGQADPLRSIFVYLVQNTTAASLGKVVQAALGAQGAAAAGPTTEVPLESAGGTRTISVQSPGATPVAGTATLPTATPTRTGAQTGTEIGGTQAGSNNNAQSVELGVADGSRSRLVIDEARNALVFVGTAQDYQRIQPLLETLDRPPREALIEVTVAELDLNDTNELGVNWSLVNRFGGKVQSVGTSSTVGGLGGGIPLGIAGFNYSLLNGVGDVIALLNAYAETDHVSVLSTPRLLAKSGTEAKIDVGTQVPIITSQGTTNTIENAGTTGILQSITYQQTGVLLSVRPIIHSGDRIELKVDQEVSSALPNTTPGISSPLIQNRTISTDLTLNDGQTVMIGGMISDNRTADDSGVPYLKNIPYIGTLFRNQSLNHTKTELLVFITPYVISDETDSASITRHFRQEMNAWPIPSTQLRW